MKKVIALLLTTMMLFSCTACSALTEGLQEGLKNAAEESNKKVTRGVTNGNVYTSEFSGLTFTKPDSWVYSTDEEIAEMMEIGEDELTDTNQFEDTIAELSTIYDMMVIDQNTGTNINIVYENLKISNGGDMEVADYIDIVKEQIAAMDYDIQETIDTVSLSGKEYQRLTTSLSYEGIEMQQIYYVRNIDSFMNVVLVTIVGDTTVADIEAMFS